MKRIFTIAAILFAQVAVGQSKMHFYFNFPVNTSVATSVPATYVGGKMADTIVAYINKAQHSIDIAQYEYVQSSTYANIATAVNNAFARGVTVRWIFDGSETNTGMNALNSNIKTLASPTTSAYGIMHNKIIIIDAANADSAWVITGSPDWNSTMFSSDYNNLVAIQDGPLAQAYTAEFNMMWGSTGNTPNAAAAKFGPDKTDLGAHTFTIDGHLVELYFSPSDHTNNHIETTIQSANTDLYFGMYTFTDNTDASLIVARKNAGVYVAGIDDEFSNSYSPHTTFTANLGSNFMVYSGSGIYHSKYLVVDPANICADPLVLTGSHNWTTAADTKNDENTLIIHSDTVANIYYQAFNGDFTGLGGALTPPQVNCNVAVPEIAADNYHLLATPNPSVSGFTFSYRLPAAQQVSLYVTDAMGRVVANIADQEKAGMHSVYLNPQNSGMYFWVFKSGTFTATGKLLHL